jgi:hypothetical protein
MSNVGNAKDGRWRSNKHYSNKGKYRPMSKEAKKKYDKNFENIFGKVEPTWKKNKGESK